MRLVIRAVSGDKWPSAVTTRKIWLSASNGHPGDVRADEIARAGDDRPQEILQAQRARKVVCGVDKKVQPAFGKRVLLQDLTDRGDLQAEFFEARDVVVASRGASCSLDEAIDFGVADAECDLLQKLGGGCQNALRHPFSSRNASSHQKRLFEA